jgi:SAM-dependent methyltransferase
VVSLSPPFPCQIVDLDSDCPLPFPDRSFDVVVCLETLEHVHDTDHLVLEIRRVLKPSGYAILSVPRIDGFLTVAMLLLGYLPPAIECSVRRRYGSPPPCGRVSGHVSHFTRRSLLELMGACGFDVDAEAQAGIYSGWKLATPGRLPLLRALPLRFLASLRVKQDDLIVRVRPRSA